MKKKEQAKTRKLSGNSNNDNGGNKKKNVSAKNSKCNNMTEEQRALALLERGLEF